MAMPEYSNLAEFLQYLNSEATRLIKAISTGTLNEDDFAVDNANRDDPFAQIYQTIIGRANDVPPEIAGDASKLEAELQKALLAEIARINQEIEAAGGYDQWLTQQGGDTDTGDTDTGDTGDGTEQQVSIQDALDQAAEELGETDQTVIDATRDFIENLGANIPTDIEELGSFLIKVMTSISVTSKDCESWTGVKEDPNDPGNTYDTWEDCVNVGAVIDLLSLPFPLPPGMVDLTVKELKDKLKEAGQSFEDFINDPAGWLEETVDNAVNKVKDFLKDLKAGTVFSTSDLDDFLRDLLGGAISGVIFQEVKDALEGEDPLLFIGDCKDEKFAEENEEYCKNYQGDEPEDQPELEGPTPEDCQKQNRTHIPGDPATNTPSKCGGCVSPFEPNSDGECVDSPEGPCPDSNQVRNEETRECEDPPIEFEVGNPCKTENGDQGTYNENGDCVADPDDDQEDITEEEDLGLCDDGKTKKADEDGTNCPGYVSTNPCENPDYAQANQEECAEFLVGGGDDDDEGDGEDTTQPEPCDDPNATLNPDGTCGPCEEGYTKIGDRCTKEEDVDDTQPEPCNDPNSQVNEDGTCGECNEGFVRIGGGLCQEQEDVIEGPDQCEDPNSSVNEDGTCGPCLEGFVRIGGVCTQQQDGDDEEEGEEEDCPEGFARDPETGECIASGDEEEDSPEIGGGGGGGGMLTSPFMARLNYIPPQPLPLILPKPQRANDIMGGLLTRMIVDRNK